MSITYYTCWPLLDTIPQNSTQGNLRLVLLKGSSVGKLTSKGPNSTGGVRELSLFHSSGPRLVL